MAPDYPHEMYEEVVDKFAHWFAEQKAYVLLAGAIGG